MANLPGLLLSMSFNSWQTGIIRKNSIMPYQEKSKSKKDPKAVYWTGQVKRKIVGDFPHLVGLENWKQLDEETFLYQKKQTRYKTKSAASEWEKDHWKKILATQVYPPDPVTQEKPLRFSEISIEYLNVEKHRWKGKNTYGYKIKLFDDAVTFWDEDPEIPIEPFLIRKFIAYLFETQTEAKANRSLRELNTLFRWAVANHFMEANPATAVDPYAEDGFKKYVPPAQDIAKTLLVANSFEKDLIRTAYHTLARSVEIRRLKWADCDFKNRQIWLTTLKRKGGKAARGSVDMNDVLHEILTRREAVSESDYVFPNRDGGQLSESTLDNVMPRIFKRLNNKKTPVKVKYARILNGKKIEQTGTRVKWIPKPEEEQTKPFGFHAIRHHVAAHLYLNHGYRVAQLQLALRHERASTTEEYLKSIVDMPDPKGLSVLNTDNFETTTSEANNKSEKKIIGYPDHKN